MTGAGMKGSNPIRPFLMFSGERHGQAEAAILFYTSIFPDSASFRSRSMGLNRQSPKAP